MSSVVVDCDSAIRACERADGYLYLTLKVLAEPCYAAMYVPNADPLDCVKKLHAAVAAVEKLRTAVGALQSAYQQEAHHA